MKLIVSPEARADLRQIEEYIGQDNPEAALEFVARLTTYFHRLVTFPGIGRKRDEIRQGHRSVTEGDYVIIYRLRQDAVEILHVVHGKRDLQNIPFAE